LNKKIKQENKKNTEKEQQTIPKEEVEAHPELSATIIKKQLYKKERKKKRTITQEKIDRLNRPRITKTIIGLTIILTILYLVGGILSILALFGLKENESWSFYQKTAIFGWQQLKVTSFVLIIISLVMLWALIYYFRKKNQEADSFLIIGSGIGSLFGIIYLLVIIADILNGLISAAINAEVIHIDTYFYLPILLAIFTLPLFRLLTIRHIVLLPEKLQPALDGLATEIEQNNYRTMHLRRRPLCGHRRRKRRKWF